MKLHSSSLYSTAYGSTAENVAVHLPSIMHDTVMQLNCSSAAKQASGWLLLQCKNMHRLRASNGALVAVGLLASRGGST
jgi:hypothetical protein